MSMYAGYVINSETDETAITSIQFTRIGVVPNVVLKARKLSLFIPDP